MLKFIGNGGLQGVDIGGEIFARQKVIEICMVCFLQSHNLSGTVPAKVDFFSPRTIMWKVFAVVGFLYHALQLCAGK